MIATKERINQNVFGMDFLGLSSKDCWLAILILVTSTGFAHYDLCLLHHSYI